MHVSFIKLSVRLHLYRCGSHSSSTIPAPPGQGVQHISVKDFIFQYPWFPVPKAQSLFLKEASEKYISSF